jgi:hypothetical protein
LNIFKNLELLDKPLRNCYYKLGNSPSDSIAGQTFPRQEGTFLLTGPQSRAGSFLAKERQLSGIEYRLQEELRQEKWMPQ